MRILKSLALTLGLIAGNALYAQSPGQVTAQPGNLAGILYASSFGQWQVPQGNQGQFSWSSASFCTRDADGFYLNPVFQVGTPVTIVDQNPANTEIVIPTAVSVTGSGCSITVAPTHPHNSFYLKSGTAGLQEAINYAKGLPYQVVVSPDWTRLGGVTSMFTAAVNGLNVGVVDWRTNCPVPYSWTGSNFLAGPSWCSGGGGTGPILLTNGTPNISQLFLNLENTATITVANPSQGNVTFTCNNAASNAFGCVKPDNTSITIASGVIHATFTFPYPGAGIPHSSGSAWLSSFGIQGTDANVPTSGTFTGSTGTSVCKDANGGVTTVGCLSSLLVEHNDSSAGINQGTINFNDTNPAPPSGNNAVTFQTDSTGRVSAYVPASTFGILPLVIPPVPGQYVILYPTSCGPLPLDSNPRTVSFCQANGASASASISQEQFSGTFPPAESQITFSGFHLPAGIPTANVTAVYVFGISQTSGVGQSFTSRACAALNVLPSGSGSWDLQQVTALTSILGPGIASMTCFIDMVNSGSQAGASGTGIDSIGAIAYYSGSPVASPNNLNIAWPLSLNLATNTLSVDPTFPWYLNGIPIAQLPSATNLFYHLALIRDGISSSDCSVGGGTTPVLCWANGTSWSAFAGGSGGSGFPITLGSTSIAASSTTTAVTGLSVNGVTLNAAGSSSLFLNQAGGYTSPAGGSVSLTSPSSTLTLSPSPITGTGTLALNLAHANTWSATQTFSNIVDTGAEATTGNLFCLQIDDTGAITNTGAVCGSGGGGGTNVKVNGGSALTTANFNATTPAAGASNQNLVFQVDGSGNISVEAPFTSASVFGLAKVDGTTITASGGVISAVGGGGSGTGAIASNATFVFTGTSINDDDNHTLEPAITVSSWSTSGSVVSFVNTGTNGFAVGDWVNARFLTGWPAVPAGLALGTGRTLFQVLSSGLSATTFQINVGALTPGTCSSSCGTIATAMNNFPFVTTNRASFPTAAVGNTILYVPAPVTIGGIDSNYTTYLHPLSPAVVGHSVYLFINDHGDDDATCTNPTSTQASYQSVFAKAHTDGYIVVVGTGIVSSFNQIIGCGTAWQYWLSNHQWLLNQGKTSLNRTSGQYWDLLVDTSSASPDGFNTNFLASAGGPGPAAVAGMANASADAIYTGATTPVNYKPWYWGAPPNQGTGASVADGFIFQPTADSAYAFNFMSANGTQEFDVNTIGNSVSVFSQLVVGNGVTNCPGSAAFCVGSGGFMRVTSGGVGFFNDITDAGASAGSGTNCLQTDTTGRFTSTGNPCVTSGFANPMTTLGDAIYGGASGVATRLAGPTTASTTFLFAWQPSGSAIAPVALNANTWSPTFAAVSTGSGSAACGTATGCISFAEGSTAGTPTSNNSYVRADTGHNLLASINGAAEAPIAIRLPVGNVTFTPATGASVVCAASYTCTNARGEFTLTGGTATTGTITSVNFSTTLAAAPFCTVSVNGNGGSSTTSFDLGHGLPTTTAFTVTAGVTVALATINIDYQCGQ